MIIKAKRLYYFIKEFLRDYGVVLLVALIVLNMLFYLILPDDYLAFLFGEIVLIILLYVKESVKSIKNRIEIGRIKTIRELQDYYNELANSSYLFSESYKLLATKPPDYEWIPGIIEKIFSNDNVFLKPIIRSNRLWVNLLNDLIKPYEDKYTELFKHIGWNEFKVRPIGIEEKNGLIIIEVEPTTYYYSYITNFSCDLPLGKGKTLRHILEPIIIKRDSVMPLKTIDESKDLPISNHIGINILLITKDGDILLSKRSSFVAVEQETIGHTVAGSLDWKTLTYLASNDMMIDLRRVILQEIAEKEEISLPSPQDYIVYPIALTRNLRFLGKPDFQLIGMINRKTEDILKNTITGRKYESIRIIRVKIMDSDTLSKEKRDLQSKCTLLELIVRKLAEPLLRGEEVLCEYIVLENDRIKIRPAKVNYSGLSSNLIIGLYAYLRAYKELCEEKIN